MSSMKRKFKRIKKSFENIKRSLVQVGAYYRSDQLDGLGIILGRGDSDSNLDVFKDFLKAYEEEWKMSKEDERKKIVEQYFGQLNHYASLRAQGKDNDRTQGEDIICIVNIWFLEKYKFLKSDEYNGCTFAYELSK